MRETKTITKHICDRCGKDCKDSNTVLNLDVIGRDFSGCAVGGVNKKYDLCEDCSNDLYYRWMVKNETK